MQTLKRTCSVAAPATIQGGMFGSPQQIMHKAPPEADTPSAGEPFRQINIDQIQNSSSHKHQRKCLLASSM